VSEQRVRDVSEGEIATHDTARLSMVEH
jgi:hypothetical protein